MSEKAIVPEEPDPDIYQIVAERRIAYDGIRMNSVTRVASTLVWIITLAAFPLASIVAFIIAVGRLGYLDRAVP